MTLFVAESDSMASRDLWAGAPPGRVGQDPGEGTAVSVSVTPQRPWGRREEEEGRMLESLPERPWTAQAGRQQLPSFFGLLG